VTANQPVTQVDPLRDRVVVRSVRTSPSRRSRFSRDRWLTGFGPDQTQYGMETGLIPEAVGPMHAFVTTARDNARVLRMSSQIGTVEPGKLADLIAVDIDPLSCPGLLADPANVRVVLKVGHSEKGRR